MAASQSLVTWLNCANITARQNGKLIQQIATLINSKSADLQMMKSVDEQSLFHIAQILPGLATCRECTCTDDRSHISSPLSLRTEINQNNNMEEEILTPQGVLNALREHRWVFSNEEQVEAVCLFVVC